MSLVIASGLSHVGKVRRHNEDSFGIDHEAQVYVVADGVGGQAAGEVASKIAVESLLRGWSEPTFRRHVDNYAQSPDAAHRRTLLRAGKEAVESAHQAILERANENPALRGMGTTLTACAVVGGELLFAHVGDSRGYLIRDDIAIQLSDDHTLLAKMTQVSGRKPGLRKDHDRWRGVLTSALGMGATVQPALFVLPMMSKDRFVLTSDGVHDYVTEAEIGSIVVAAASPSRAGQALIDKALERGGEDNATAIVMKVVEAAEVLRPADQIAREEAAISACGLFADLHPRERLRALRVAIPRSLTAGEALPMVTTGELVTYVITQGAVAWQGRKLGPGAVLYPHALVMSDGGPHASAAARADVDTEVLALRRDDFVELTEDDAELGVKLYAALARLVTQPQS